MTTFIVIALALLSFGLGFALIQQKNKYKDYDELKNNINEKESINKSLEARLSQKTKDFDTQNKNNKNLFKKYEFIEEKYKKTENAIILLQQEIEIKNNDYEKQKAIYKDFEIINQQYIKPFEGLKLLNEQLSEEKIKLKNLKEQGQQTYNKIKLSIDQEKKINQDLLLTKKNLEIKINDYKKDIDLYQETFNFYEYGISEPIFGNLDSEKYKNSIKSEIEQQKLLVTENKGVINRSIQYKEETKSDFNKRITTINKNILSAFNREVENISLNLTVKNFNKMIEQLKKTFETLNKNNSINKCHTAVISNRYFQSKKNEISFKFKYEHAKERAKEEQEEIKAQMREEERESKIIEREQLKALKAAQKAEEEEIKFQEQLTLAQNELKKIMEEQSAENIHKLNQSMQQTEIMKNEMEDKIKLLQLELLEATKAKDRNLSMAQQTRKGHVYVISNVGSFGEGVYKIGMTRRLEPLDRVKELSSASVPFEFDIHAIIYSEDAPALEAELHRQFSNERVNLVNLRKEFFKVDLNSIQEFLDNKGINTEITLSALANNYYESISIRDIAKNKNVPVATLLRNHTESIEEEELEDTGTIDENIIQDEQRIIRTSMFG